LKQVEIKRADSLRQAATAAINPILDVALKTLVITVATM
jgi:hypothetical protein